MEIKPIEEIKENFRTGAANVPARYVRGVKRAKWQQPSIDGQTLYVAQMQNQEVLGRRSKGIAKVSDDSWRNDAATKGGAVIGPRIVASVDKQASGFAPYREVIANLTLPQRTGDVMTNVTNRVGAIATALSDKKKEMMG